MQKPSHQNAGLLTNSAQKDALLRVESTLQIWSQTSWLAASQHPCPWTRWYCQLDSCCRMAIRVRFGLNTLRAGMYTSSMSNIMMTCA